MAVLSKTVAKRARDFFMSTPRRETVARMFNLVVARVQTLTTGSLQQNNCSHNSRFNSINAQVGESLSAPRSGGLSPDLLAQLRYRNHFASWPGTLHC